LPICDHIEYLISSFNILYYYRFVTISNI